MKTIIGNGVTPLEGVDPGVVVMQAGALFLEHGAEPSRILLVASKLPGRWGIPKGHREPGETSAQTAEREAFEEAGITGFADPEPLGHFTYRKPTDNRLYEVTVHLITGAVQVGHYPEMLTRACRWVHLAQAEQLCFHSGLKALLRSQRRRIELGE